MKSSTSSTAANKVSTAETLRLKHEQPAFIYGTAWKKDRTKELVKEALSAGFRRVDTAAQPRHYREDLVGEALREAYSEENVRREDIYLQTKFTSPGGQDLSNMPYDPNAPLEKQIRTSIASSLHNFRHLSESTKGSYIDCLLLHSPLHTVEETLDAWSILESYVPNQIRTLGISNVDLPVLKAIYHASTVKPSVVQNRFYAQTEYDLPLRAFCREHQIAYQSFWTLTGNPVLLKLPIVKTLAESVSVSEPVALYALVMDLGVEVLNGTTSSEHMKDDLEGVTRVCEWMSARPEQSGIVRKEFKSYIGQ